MKKKGKNNNFLKNNNPMIYKNPNDVSCIHNQFIQHLLQPKNYINLPENIPFRFSSE